MAMRLSQGKGGRKQEWFKADAAAECVTIPGVNVVEKKSAEREKDARVLASSFSAKRAALALTAEIVSGIIDDEDTHAWLVMGYYVIIYAQDGQVSYAVVPTLDCVADYFPFINESCSSVKIAYYDGRGSITRSKMTYTEMEIFHFVNHFCETLDTRINPQTLEVYHDVDILGMCFAFWHRKLNLVLGGHHQQLHALIKSDINFGCIVASSIEWAMLRTLQIQKYYQGFDFRGRGPFYIPKYGYCDRYYQLDALRMAVIGFSDGANIKDPYAWLATYEDKVTKAAEARSNIPLLGKTETLVIR